MSAVGRNIALGGIVALGLTYLYALVFPGYPEARLLPVYTLYTFARIGIVFIICLFFGLGVGVLAATNRLAGKVIIPIFDILQSVPILGYFPILLVSLIVAFPGTVGLELGVLVLLFTAMEWSIFFGVVGAIKAIPRSVEEAASSFGMRGWPYFRHVILPAVIPALLSASTLAWNDGWTFDIASEYVTYGSSSYAVSGLGSFIYRASTVDVNILAAWLGLLVIGEVVIITNQLIWHRLAEHLARRKTVFGFHPPERIVHPLRAVRGPARRILGLRFRVETLNRARFKYSFSTKVIAISFVVVLAAIGLILDLPNLVPGLSFLATALQGQDLTIIPIYTLFTLGRLAFVYFIVLFVSLAAAFVAVRSKGFTKYFYALYDMGRAIPYLALFPPLFATLVQVMPGELGLELSSFFLLFMGMVWYVIFNVVTAATFLPAELREVSALFGFRGWSMLRNVLIPAVLPAIITGSILAWGGGWNVVIYSEYISLNQGGTVHVYTLPGLGYLLDQAANAGSSALVVFYLFIMSGIVILLGRLVWRRLLHRVERRGTELT